MRQIEKRKRHLKKSEKKNYRGASKNFQVNGAFDAVLLEAATERERDCRADDEKEKRKNHIRRCPAVPRRVFERGVNGTPISRIIDQNHSGDRYAAKNIERD